MFMELIHMKDMYQALGTHTERGTINHGGTENTEMVDSAGDRPRRDPPSPSLWHDEGVWN